MANPMMMEISMCKMSMLSYGLRVKTFDNPRSIDINFSILVPLENSSLSTSIINKNTY